MCIVHCAVIVTMQFAVFRKRKLVHKIIVIIVIVIVIAIWSSCLALNMLCMHSVNERKINSIISLTSSMGSAVCVYVYFNFYFYNTRCIRIMKY